MGTYQNQCRVLEGELRSEAIVNILQRIEGTVAQGRGRVDVAHTVMRETCFIDMPKRVGPPAGGDAASRSAIVADGERIQMSKQDKRRIGDGGMDSQMAADSCDFVFSPNWGTVSWGVCVVDLVAIQGSDVGGGSLAGALPSRPYFFFLPLLLEILSGQRIDMST